MSDQPEKPKRGRPFLPKGTALRCRNVRLSDDHWAKAKALGEDGEASDGIRRGIMALWLRRKFSRTPSALYTVGENERGWNVYSMLRVICTCKLEADARRIAAALAAYEAPEDE